MKKINNFKKIFLVLVLVILFIPVIVNAGGDATPGGSPQLENPLNATSVTELVSDIVTKFVIPVGGVIVVLAIIYAGFLFIKAQGNPTEIEKAKSVLLWVVIGSAILLGASVLANIVKNTIKSLGP